MCKIYNVVLVGCGQMGEEHISRIYYKNNVNIKYVCDYDLKKAENLKNKYNVEYAETNIKKCIEDKDVDIVICATYPSSHLNILRLCIKNKKHLICEKPITNDLETGEEFVKLVKENPYCKVLIGHILRHNETYQKIAEMIQSGIIGFPIIIRMSQNHHTMNWSRYLKLIEETSPIIDCGVHYIDIMKWFTGENIIDINGIGQRTEKDVPIDKYNYGLITMHLSNGSIGYYEAGWGNTIAADNLKEFIGPKGRIKLIYQKDRSSHQEEGDLIEFYQFPEKIYHNINIKCDRKPCDKQFDYLIKMIEENIPATPSIDEVFDCFKLSITADAQIKNKIL